MRRNRWTVLVIAVTAVACDDPTKLATPNDEMLTATASAAGSPQERVEIDRVRLALGGAKLETAGVDGTEDWISEAASVVEATVTGTVARARVLLNVPVGTYKALELKIDKLERGKAGEDALIGEHSSLADASIAIDGRVVEPFGTEDAFTFSAVVDQGIKIEFRPFLEVGGAQLEVMLVLTSAEWFKDDKGTKLDPRDPGDRSSIESNVKESVRAVVIPGHGPPPGPVMDVVIDRVRLVLGGAKLDKAGVDASQDWSSEESSVIDADLSGAGGIARTRLDAPAGTYKSLELKIDKLEHGKPGEDPLLAQHPILNDASIAIDGRILRAGGTEEYYTFVAVVDQGLKIEFQPFLIVGTAGLDVSLVFSTSGWFRDDKGTQLDPRRSGSRSAIESNIKQSFRAFVSAL